MVLAAVIVAFRVWWCTLPELQSAGYCHSKNVTYSTAEAELVRYCEALCAGRAKQALICSMLKEPVGQNSLERISMVTTWLRFQWHVEQEMLLGGRDMRVRSSFPKEALDGVSPDGAWKRLHLQGTELVADGLTKPLAGQAFFKFVDDLGFARARAEESNRESTGHATGGGGSSAAIRAMALGSVLLSTAEGAPNVNEAGEEFSLIWTAGLLLMATVAVYAGQLFHSASKCCLKRPRESKESGQRASLRRMSAESSDDESILVVSEAEESVFETKAKRRREGASSEKKNGKVSVSAAAGPVSRSRDQIPVATGPSSNPLSSLTPEQGPPTSRPCPTSMSLRKRSGTRRAGSEQLRLRC